MSRRAVALTRGVVGAALAAMIAVALDASGAVLVCAVGLGFLACSR